MSSRKFVLPSRSRGAVDQELHKGPAFFVYSNNYLIDVKFGVIVTLEASRAVRQVVVGAAKTMIERIEQSFGLKLERFVAIPLTGQLPC